MLYLYVGTTIIRDSFYEILAQLSQPFAKNTIFETINQWLIINIFFKVIGIPISLVFAIFYSLKTTAETRANTQPRRVIKDY